MMIPDHLRERVRAMVAEIGYTRAAWFCRAHRRSLIRWVKGQVDAHNGTIALLEYGTSRWERARPRAEVSYDTSGASHSRN